MNMQSLRALLILIAVSLSACTASPDYDIIIRSGDLYDGSGSDAGSLRPEGDFLNSNPHPRAYGNFSRLLGKYVREEGLIPLEEAIRRITSLPAENLRLERRGSLSVGHFADVVVFDPNTITDHATYSDPHQLSTGVSVAIVNGTLVLSAGEHTGEKPGRALRRTK